MSTVTCFEDLEIWQRACEICKIIALLIISRQVIFQELS